MTTKKTRKKHVEEGARPKKTSSAGTSVKIDFPAEGETVQPGHYTVRISATKASVAEVSVDGAAWIPCRESVGFFWYDWEPVVGGTHRLEARAKMGAVYRRSLVRICTVAMFSPAFG